MEFSYKINTDELDRMIRKLGSSNLYTDVGILGAQARLTHPSTRDKDDDSKQSVAQIGAHHEFGAPKANVPQRSFLRWPIEDDLFWNMIHRLKIDELVKLFLFNQKELMNVIGLSALDVIKNAFDRSGTTKRNWQVLSPKYARTKKTDQILVETKTLRESISYRVGGE